MIILPNSFEIYLKNLRNYNSLSILKHGLLQKHINNIKKIYLAEMFLFKNNKSATNLKLLSYNLLCCVKNVKDFNFIITINQHVKININLYSALLLTLSKISLFLKIEYKNGVIIKGSGNIKTANKIIYFLNGYSFFDIKTKNFLIYIPAKTITTSPAPTISQWELIFDKFSVFNLFFAE